MPIFLYIIFLVSCNNTILLGADRESLWHLDAVESWRANYNRGFVTELEIAPGIILITISPTDSLISLPVSADDALIVVATTTKAKEAMVTHEHNAEGLQPTPEKHKSSK